MQRLKSLNSLAKRICKVIICYPRERSTSSRENREYDIDNMILSHPRHTLRYFMFEYGLCAFFSFAVMLISLLQIYLDTETTSKEQFPFLYWWLHLGVILNMMNVVVKLFIIRRLHKIPQNVRLIVRRLMLLIRSNIFMWNDRMCFVMYNFYIIGMCKLATTNICGNMKIALYRLCHFILCCFLLRLGNIFMRFLVEYYYLTRNIQYDSIIDSGASMEEISKIPVLEFNERNFSDNLLRIQWCAICLEYFKLNEKVVKLPCANQHFFHQVCAENWLKKQNICPYCRQILKIKA